MLNRYLIAILTFVNLSPIGCLLAQQQERVPLPEAINSSYIEIRPIISADGQMLFFGRREHPDNIKGDKDMQDIYVVEREGDGWGVPYNLKEPINNRFANSLGSVSPAVDELLLLNNYRKANGPLARYMRQGDVWSEAQSVIIEDFDNQSEYFDFFQSYHEDVLLLSVEREDSKGEQDIFVCFRKDDGNWAKPLNLGPMINTKKSDFAPFLAADGRTLFFATYGRKGKGGADLFYAQRLDDSWTKWSAPVNLGVPINSSGEETYCSVTEDGRNIFYTSYRHGSEVRDIYMSPLPPNIQFMEPLPGHKMITAVSRSLKSVKTLEVAVGDDGELNAPFPAEDSATDAVSEAVTVLPQSSEPSASQQEPVKPALAETSVQPERQVASSLTVTTEPKKQLLSATAAGQLPLSIKHVAVVSDIPDKKQFSILKNVYYDFNQIDIKSENYTSLLQQLIDFLAANPEASLIIEGHADEYGTKRENLQISQLRSQSVKQYLVKQGVAPERLLIHFKGEEEPLATNDDEREGRELNRRVEFFILMPAG